MSSRDLSRFPARVLFGAAALSLVVMTGCSSSTDESTGDAPTTTTAAAADGSDTDGTTPGTMASDSPGTTMAEVTEVGNSEIREAMEADEPELWALVNYDYMSWNAFGGFNIPLVEGADETQAVELCEAVSTIVYEGGNYAETSIVIATGADTGDIMGTPIVERTNEAGTCAEV